MLVAAGLVRLERPQPEPASAAGWLVHAAAARYTVRATVTEAGGQPSLFEEDEA